MLGVLVRALTPDESEIRDGLDLLHRQLVAVGVPPTLIQRVTANPEPTADVTAPSPQLVIYGESGWRVATISVGPRSGMYLVDTAQVGSDNGRMPDLRALVPPAMAHRAVRLVAQAYGAGTA
jgi:hypothetical protein